MISFRHINRCRDEKCSNGACVQLRPDWYQYCPWINMDDGAKGVKMSRISQESMISDKSRPCFAVHSQESPATPGNQPRKDIHLSTRTKVSSWSNEDERRNYHSICTQQKMPLPSNHTALALFDVFKGQQTESITPYSTKSSLDKNFA